MSPETRAKLSASLKAFWAPERRKAHGVEMKRRVAATRLPRLMSKRLWEAREKGWEMSEWPREPANCPPTLTPAIRAWLLTQAKGQAELERWREKRRDALHDDEATP